MPIAASQPFPCIAHLRMGGVRKVVIQVKEDISLTTTRGKKILRFEAKDIKEIWIGAQTLEFQSSVSPEKSMTIAAKSWHIALEFRSYQHRVLFLDSIRALLKHHRIPITDV